MKYNTKNYDYLIVGAGPYGAIFAHEAAKRGKRSLIIERRGRSKPCLRLSSMERGKVGADIR